MENIMPITTISTWVPYIHLQHFNKSVLNHLNQKDLTTALGELSMVFLISTTNTPYLAFLAHLQIPELVLVGFSPSAELQEHFLFSFLMFSYSHCIILEDTTNTHLPILTCNPCLKSCNRFNECTTHRISTIHH